LIPDLCQLSIKILDKEIHESGSVDVGSEMRSPHILIDMKTKEMYVCRKDIIALLRSA